MEPGPCLGNVLLTGKPTDISQLLLQRTEINVFLQDRHQSAKHGWLPWGDELGRMTEEVNKALNMGRSFPSFCLTVVHFEILWEIRFPKMIVKKSNRPAL